MEINNYTDTSEFIVLGLSDLPRLQIPLFIVFFLIYIGVILGNSLIICVVCTEPRLQRPMYFFLVNLSFLEICCISVTVPKMLQMLLTQIKMISFCACISQMYFFLLFTVVELYLLSAMAYDRYVAICNPLHYTVIMTKTVCLVLAAGCWLIGGVLPLAHTILLSQSTFCGKREINHFFCDTSALMMKSCSGITRMEIFSYTEGTIFGFSPFVLTLTSYVFIIHTILRIRSTDGKRKAFATCSSHLMVVVLFYSSILGIYMRPTSNFSMDENKLASIVYVNAIPLLNPLIYGLRNKDVKKALCNTFRKRNSCIYFKTDKAHHLVSLQIQQRRNEKKQRAEK